MTGRKQTIRGKDWTGQRSRQLSLSLHEERGIMLDIADLPEELAAGADEIRLDHDHARRLLEALAALLTELQPADAGPAIHGYIGLNGLDQVCFFPHSHAEGIPLPDRYSRRAGETDMARQIRFLNDTNKFFEAVDSAPIRRVHIGALHTTDPPNPLEQR